MTPAHFTLRLQRNPKAETKESISFKNPIVKQIAAQESDT